MAEVTVNKSALTMADLLELKLEFDMVMLKAKEKFGNSVRLELNITDVKPTDVMTIHNVDDTAKWNVGKSGVTIEAMGGRINITDDSMPF